MTAPTPQDIARARELVDCLVNNYDSCADAYDIPAALAAALTDKGK